MADPRRVGEESPGWSGFWPLDPGIAFLNHGSYGACPREILDLQAALRAELEAEPVRFLGRELDDRLDAARAAVAAFVGADADDLAFVGNATSGVNAVLRSIRLSPGDELLTTDHCYQACRNTLDFVAERSGAKVVVVTLPFPVSAPQQIVDTVLAGATERTRLCLLDHITSPTALVLPIQALVRALAARGIDTLVDGAHGPGMVPLDLTALGAAYYTGNCHKWLCTPKGSAFLWVRRDRQAGIHPLTISHGATGVRAGRTRFRLEFDWTGTQDPTGWLTVPRAIEYLGGLVPGGWPALMARNRALALEARRRLCAAAGTPPACPDEMIGSIASVMLPDNRTVERGWRVRDPLQGRLFDRWRIEVPIMRWLAPPRRLIRISAQLYNRLPQYTRLAEALTEELAHD